MRPLRALSSSVLATSLLAASPVVGADAAVEADRTTASRQDPGVVVGADRDAPGGADRRAPQAAPGQPVVPPGTSRLSDEQRAAAVALARTDIAEADLLVDERLYLVSVHWFHDKRSSDEKALVVHYRTTGDLTIRHRINLTAGEVERRMVAAHTPTGLSREEFEEAHALALADAQVRSALGEKALADVVVEPMVMHGMPAGAPDHGHRVVRLLFRIGSDYLHRPVVHVDLTDRSVRIESKDPDGPR